MKKILYIVSIVLNIILYFLLQVISSFFEFGLLGSGDFASKNAAGISFVFLLIHIAILFFGFKKRVIVKDITMLIINALLAVSLFFYYAL